MLQTEAFVKESNRHQERPDLPPFIRQPIMLPGVSCFLTSRPPSEFHIMHPLVPVVKILKKIGISWKIWEKAGGQNFKGSYRGECQF